MASTKECPYPPGLYILENFRTQEFDFENNQFVPIPPRPAVPVIVLRDVTDYELRRLVLRFDIEVMFPDGIIAVFKSMPDTYRKLTPLNNTQPSE
jgi:hypothetical protein